MNEMQTWLMVLCIALGVVVLGLGAYSLLGPKKRKQAPAAVPTRPEPEPLLVRATATAPEPEPDYGFELMDRIERIGKSKAGNRLIDGFGDEMADEMAERMARGASRASKPAGAAAKNA